MNNYPRLPHSYNVDPVAECFYQYVYGSNDIFYPHCHDFYEIFITVKGTVTHLINDTVQYLSEGSLVFIRPDDTHGYIYDDPQSRESAYINLAFSRETASTLFEYLSQDFPTKSLLSSDMPPIIILSGAEKERILARISELNSVNWQDKKALKIRMRAILADIFARHFYKTAEEKKNDMPIWLSTLLSEMERPENFVAGMDRMITLSGKTNELRLNYATNLITRTNTPIIEICYACGFGSVSYFYRIFKNKHSVSPHQFREKLKNG